jgi:signal transduction histidine kinase/ligand-binding sensor domain-containing protein
MISFLTEKIIFLVINIILVNAGLVFPQSYLVHTYNENDGLSNSAVYDVAQDTSGQLWFATRAGISAYDGTQWKSYTVAEGLLTTSYSKIMVDEQGITWILPHAPNLSISYFAENRWTSLPRPDVPSTVNSFSSFEVLYENHQRTIFVATDSAGLYRFADETWQQITPRDGLLSYCVNGIAQQNNKLFVATDKGISIIEGNRVDNSLNDKIHLPSYNIVGITIDHTENDSAEDDKIWLHGEQWVGYIQQGAFQLFSRDVKCILDRLNHYILMQPDLSGGLFYGNIYDIYHLKQRSGSIERLGRKSSLITEGATSFLIDREKNLWITSLRGVSKIQSMRFKNYSKVQGLLENEVTAIAEIEPGRLVFGHENGLTFFNNANFRTLSFLKDQSTSEVTTRVLDIAVDDKKNTWVAASMLGLAKIEKGGNIRWFRKDAGFEGIVASVLVDRRNRIWISDIKGLHVFDGEKFVLLNIHVIPDAEPGKLFPYIRKIFQGPDDSIYLATVGKGVFIYKNKAWTQYLSIDKNQANSVYSILIDSQNRTWIGTIIGLYTLQDNYLKKYRSNNFEIDRPVYLIVEDTKKCLWFGTDNGIIRWDGTTSRKYTIHQGFVGQETNRAAGLVDSERQVWIGADLGVSCYQEQFDYDQPDIPPPLIELLSLDVLGEKMSPHNITKLSYLKNTIIFQFRGISFIDEKSIRYRYKLQDYDSDWIFEDRPSTQQVRYTNLSPGRYQFHIQAQNSLDSWSAVKSSSLIIIRPPFWNTNWFRGIAILSLIIMLSMIYYGRVSLLKRKQQDQQAFSRRLIEEVEKGRKRIASELHDGLGQNLLITKNELEQCRLLPGINDQFAEKLKEISAIITESIDEVREISYNLHPHQLDRLGLTRAINSIITKSFKPLEITISKQIDDLDNLFPKQVEIHLYRIIQEALNNIVKHADAKNVFIIIKKLERAVNILIKDDGKGFDYKKYASDQSETVGLGLTGIMERVKILQGKLIFNSVLNKGTAIKIKIPIL